MDKNVIGSLFIVAGVAYGSLASDKISKATLGYLLENDWIKLPDQRKTGKSLLGPKSTILAISAILIIIGIYILWKNI